MSTLNAFTSSNAVLGAVLVKLRTKKGMKQQDLANALSMSASAWSRIEKGETGLSISQLKRVAEVLGETPSTILEMAEFAEQEAKRQGLQVLTDPSDERAGASGSTSALQVYGSALGKLLWNNPDTMDIFNLLRRATLEERQILTNILSGNEKAAAWSASTLVEELCMAGGHSFANMVRGHGTSYAEIVINVYSALRLDKPAPPLDDYLKAETKIVEALFARIVEGMTDEQKRDLENEITKLAGKFGKSYVDVGITGSALIAGGAAGFAPYLMATTALGGITGFLGITLPFAVYTGLTSTISVILGPVGWAGLAAYGVYKLGSPNLKKMVPSVALVNAVRTRLALQHQLPDFSS